MSKVMELPKADIDRLTPKRSLIDLDKYTEDNFTLLGYELSKVLDDVLLIQYVDITKTGELVRNGIVIPQNQIQKAWRIGKVVLAGPLAKYVKEGDYVCFPNDKGIPVSNIAVEGTGTLKDATFLNEDRIFGVVTPAQK
jgi:co-chaperonin GroES (HSP10)